MHCPSAGFQRCKVTLDQGILVSTKVVYSSAVHCAAFSLQVMQSSSYLLFRPCSVQAREVLAGDCDLLIL
jgi:hypothetical protein